jgi:hypothetical protein
LQLKKIHCENNVELSKKVAILSRNRVKLPKISHMGNLVYFSILFEDLKKEYNTLLLVNFSLFVGKFDPI